MRYSFISNCRYPGLRAPASLKLGGRVRAAQIEAGLSGASRPGLIEAILSSRIDSIDIMVIRGFAPRPH